MIPTLVLAAFAKEAAHPYLHAGLGVAGASALGWEALKYLNPEQRLERRMMEMGEMSPELFQKRTRRRLAEVAGAAAVGGAAGAAAPWVAEQAYLMGKARLTNAIREGLNRGRSGVMNEVGGLAEEAGRRAVRGGIGEAGDQARKAGRGIRSFLGF